MKPFCLCGGALVSTGREHVKEHAWGGNVTQSKCVSIVFATANRSVAMAPSFDYALAA